uniref:Uncharacterized protein n=1 Tax=Anguilla anguilla TaxID=7936 RepID=A0A0E9SDJ8_ANGAN
MRSETHKIEELYWTY